MPEPISGNISLDLVKKCDANLSALEYKKCNLFSKSAFGWWKVKTMMHALSAMNAPVDLACIRCPQEAPHRAGYSPKHNVVWVCSNHVWNPFEFRRLVAHELVHAFDFARAKVDPKNLKHIACSEVRAWNLSGECELWTKSWDYFGGQYVGERKRCVRSSSVESVKQSGLKPSDQEAEAVVDEIFEKCRKDYWPFTHAPELDNRWIQPPYLTDKRK